MIANKMIETATLTEAGYPLPGLTPDDSAQSALHHITHASSVRAILRPIGLNPAALSRPETRPELATGKLFLHDLLLSVCHSKDTTTTHAIKVLLSLGAPKNGVPTRGGPNKDSMPPLVRLALTGHLEGVKLLLSNGCNLDQRGPLNTTAFMNAIAMGHTQIAEHLLDAGANPHLRSQTKFKKESNTFLLANSALDLLATQGNTAGVKFLLNARTKHPASSVFDLPLTRFLVRVELKKSHTPEKEQSIRQVLSCLEDAIQQEGISHAQAIFDGHFGGGEYSTEVDSFIREISAHKTMPDIS